MSALVNHIKIVQQVKIHVLTYLSVLIAFWLSSYFVINHEHYQLISIVAAVTIAAVLVFRYLAFIPVSLAFFSYYLFVGKPVDIALIYSLLLPLLPILTALSFIRIEKRMVESAASSKLLVYVLTFALFYPLVSTLAIFVISAISEQNHTTKVFLLYSFLGSSLTQLTVTPALLLLLAFIRGDETHEFRVLDKALRRTKATDFSYLSWLLCCLVLMIVAVKNPSSLVLYASCFTLLLLVVIGFGKHGLIRPLFMGASTVLLMVSDSLKRVNTYNMLDEQFIGFMVILLIVTIMGYLVGGYAIKYYEAAQQQIRAERLDPYTGLFNLSQLQEDLQPLKEAVLVYLDLSPTLSRLNELGYEGKAKLIRHIYRFINTNQQDSTKCYRPPFTSGVLAYLQGGEENKPVVNQMATHLDNFQFYWQGSSIALVSPTLHCVVVRGDQDITDVVSHLCEHQATSDQLINWIESDEIGESHLDKLAYIQQVFKYNLFELYCQPYLKLADPESTQLSFEVLTRVHSTQHTRLTPAEFFPLINQFGLEVQLDKWVVENSFKTLNQYVTDWTRIEKCAINLTARSLAVAELSDWIIAQAEKYAIPLHCICFEVTESSALQNEHKAIETLKVLRNAGSKIALDDFGTGYASFAYLRRLPLDIVKIDGEFIRDLTTNETDKLIVESISNVAKDIGLETVAEFVESEQHIELLKQWNITFAQGYAVSKPLPLVEMLAAREAHSSVQT